MKLLKSFMINCQESTLLSSKQAEEKLSMLESFKLHFHIMMCKPCNFFANQIKIIHSSLKNISKDSNIFFTEEQKVSIQEKINNSN